LNDRAALKNTPDEIFFSVIRSGVPNTQMPSWSVDFGGPLTDEDIHDVVAFLRAWEPTAPEILPQQRVPDPTQGALLFSSTCALCHGEDGLGGKGDIPALNDPARLAQFDDGWYRSVIAYGRPAKGMPTWGTVLAPAQIDDLVALLAAWRQGKVIRPAFSVTTLLDLAAFSLSQGDELSARLHISRALEISDDPAANQLRQIEALIFTGDLPAAAQALNSLIENWPPGNGTSD
jgi:mono/diheme cytochrome c family protein